PYNFAVDYEVKAFRIIDGITYYSAGKMTSGTPQGNGDNSPALPTNVTASTDIPNHIKICWDYPNFIFSDFVIKRNGVVIANVGTEARAYYDYDAPKADEVIYSVQADYQGDLSQEALAVGRLKYYRSLSGRVQKAQSGRGVGSVVIEVRTETNVLPFLAQTQTDSAGYYLIENIPCTDRNLIVKADYHGSDFSDDGSTTRVPSTEQTLAITTTTDEYTVNFTDYYEPEFEADSVAIILNVSATPEPQNMGVKIAWSPSSPNYTGFELYRGTASIAQVMKGEALTYLDTLGTGGIGYSYRVRAFWDSPEGRVYSDYGDGGAIFPALAPATNFTATPVPEANHVLLRWSHLYDSHDAYLVKSNDIIIATIETGNELIFADTVGIPGRIYNYTVEAVKGNQISEPATARLTYPNPNYPRNFNVNTIPSLNVSIFFWDYPANTADGFEIYRDEVLISTVKSNTEFRDTFGIPGFRHTYRVEAFIIRNNEQYNSRSDVSDSDPFPVLTPPINPNVLVSPQSGEVEFQFDYPAPGVDGFNIFRNNVQIGTIIKDEGETSFALPDDNAAPGQTFTYAVEAFAERAGSLYLSARTEITQTIGALALPAPAPFSASRYSQGAQNINVVQLSWSYNIEVDGFELFAGGTLIEDVDGGTRQTFYLDNNSYSNIDNVLTEFTIRSYKTIAGTKYYSPTTLAFGSSSQTQSTVPIARDGNTQFGQLGFRIAAAGHYAAVAAPFEDDNRGRVYLYRREGRKWSLINTIDGNLGDQIGTDLSMNVDASGYQLVIGTPGRDFNTTDNGGYMLYTAPLGAGGGWSLIANIGQQANALERFGQVVGVSGDHIVMGNRGTNRVIAVYTNGQRQPADILKPNANYQTFTHDIAVRGDYMAVGDPTYVNNSNNRKGAVALYKKSGSTWAFLATIENPDVGTSLNFGHSVDLSEDHLIVGDVTRKAHIYARSGDNFILQTSLTSPFNSSQFGTRVSIDKNTAVVGADGAFALYRKNGNTWQLLRTTFQPNFQSLAQFGIDVAVSGNYLTVGAKAQDVSISGFTLLDAGKVYSFEVDDLLTTLSASENLNGRTELNWSVNGDPDIISGFRVYRGDNSQPIATLDASARSYIDNDGVAGEKYTYTVYADDEIGFGLDVVSVVGFSSPIGEISGQVRTLQGNAPVQGVTITAKAQIGGQFYTYTDVTNAVGNFFIDEVFIGDDEATYTLTPTKTNSDFDPGSETIILSENQNTSTASLFLETTSYVVQGTVGQQDNVCGLDSISVKATSVFLNGNKTTQQVTTDEEGRYTFTFDPTRSDLDSFNIQVDSFKITNLDQPVRDTIGYEFVAQQQNIFTRTDFTAGLNRTTTVDFLDTKTYPVELRVQNTCEVPISNDLWTIRARTLDGCYDKSFVTQSTGRITVNLPPLNLVLKVTKVNNQTANNLQALAYFKTQSNKLNLLDLHTDSSRVVTAARMAELTQQTFTYHRAPSVKLLSGLDRFFCDDLSKAAIVEQGNFYGLTLNVEETHNGSTCAVSEGYLRITNPASDNSTPVTLPYDPMTNSFGSYDFVGGNPNLVEPHLYALTVEYFSPQNDFLGDLIIPVFVEGTAAIPGTDVIVNPGQGDQVQLPLFVLRDPPGDGSSSSIAEGSTISKSINVNQSESGGLSAYLDQEIKIFGVGGSFNLSATVGGGGSQAESWKYSMTTSSKISTSSSQTKRGRLADVVVGAGLAMQYGLVQELMAGDCDTIFQNTRLGFSPHSVNTTWLYTVQQVENIIKEFTNDSIRVENGTLIYEDAGVVLTKQAALDRLSTYLNNWKKILEYHDVETLPHYALCTREDKYSSLRPEFRAEIETWQNQFCTRIGSYNGDKFAMNDNATIIWDNELVDLYNQADAAIRNLSDPIPEPGTELLWAYNPERSDYADSQYDAQFGVAAENFTYGGATSINQSYNAARTSSKSFSSSFNFGLNFNIGFGFGSEINFIVAPFGLGTLVKVADLKTKIGVKTNFKYNISESRSAAESESVSVSYTLADGDIGDQFSVTAIQGPAPNHTPYFSLLGGRSSCPPEDGTIHRDQDVIQLIDPATGAATDQQSRFAVPADEAASFLLKLTNNNPFNETRNLIAFLDNASNTGGAVVKLGGSFLGSQTFYGVGPGGNNAVTLPLTVERGVFSYNHTIRIGLRPLCVDGTASDASTYVTVNVDFENPCTPVSIV
ncbi:MAG: hypothetical protein AB8G22_17595, partial [Saprospiraceae bacterium]